MKFPRIARRARRAALSAAVAGFGLAGGLLCPSAARAQQLIGVDFYGTGGGGTTGASAQLPPTEPAGIIPFANWNSFTGAAQATPQPLMDATGTATGATVAWTANNTWNTPTVAGPGNFRMMKGYLDSTDTSVTSVTVANLPAS